MNDEIFKNKQFLAVAGILIFVAGMFMPLEYLQPPSWLSASARTWSYLAWILNGDVISIAVVFLDGIALVFIIKKQYRLLLYSASVNLLLLSYQFYERLRDVVLLNDLAKKTLKINSFAREMNLEEIPDISVPEIQFGWFFLFLGLGLIFTSALVKESKKGRREINS